ncbi:MAG: glycosyltransferase [Pseudomonadota bacterium]
MSASPDVSVLMPVRDGRFLADALRTIQHQDFDAFEIVIVDDASDADTHQFLQDAARTDGRIRILRREKSRGLAWALNAGLDLCRAPLVARADADDLYAPDRLARQRAVFLSRPSLAALSCGWRRIDAEGKILFTHRPATGPSNLRFRTMFGAPLLHPGVMYRADAVRKVGGYDPAYWTAQDSDLWARMAPMMELDNLVVPLVDWRLHDKAVTSARGDEGRKLSLSIPLREQSAYLSADLSERDVAASVDTFSSAAPLSIDILSRGERHLNRLCERARQNEPVSVVRDIHDAVAKALLRQCRWALRDGRIGDGARLLRRSVAWRVGTMSKRAVPRAPIAVSRA